MTAILNTRTEPIRYDTVSLHPLNTGGFACEATGTDTRHPYVIFFDALGNPVDVRPSADGHLVEAATT